MDTQSDNQWHSLSVEAVSKNLQSDFERGLSTGEIETRRQKYGPNMMTGKKGIGSIKRFLLQFHQALVYVLIASGAVSLFLGEWVDASVIFGVVILNSIIGAIQEGRAEKAIESLKKMIVTEATVIRQGRTDRIPSVELVPGDIVFLQSGDKVPADMRLFKIRNLQIDESSLTGESVPVEKSIESLADDTGLADRTNLSYAGSLVTSGQGHGVVVEIGNRTETGRISQMITESVELSTPLTRKIEHFSHILLYAILGLAVLTFIVGVLRGGHASEMFMAAVALAVGAIPEGLPAVVTITLAIGVRKMAHRRAIIRKLPAVETLGSTTIICTDKTGTLTENQMTIRKILIGSRMIDVTGSGYAPQGELVDQGQKITPAELPTLNECLTAGILCNDAHLIRNEDRWSIQGDPTEGSLITAARKAGLDDEALHKRYPRIDVLPFESQYQYMATLHKDAQDSKHYIYMKGAVEKVLDRCSGAMDEQGNVKPLDRNHLHTIVEQLTSEGLRVLAFARGEVALDVKKLHHESLPKNMVFLGLQAMIDPPRAEVIDAVKNCRSAGIRVKMITGDHIGTASAIGRMIGLGQAGSLNAITGHDLEKLSDEALIDVADRTDIFARVAPEQKLRLVKALQTRGHIVAMTGDGVNDAPALKRADIGVAMGITGTDVSKEAADMLLTDDNFATIEAAVEEGRGVFDNLTKFIAYILPTNGGQGLIILAAILAGLTLPVLPVQILWINMTVAVFLGLALAFEPKEEGLMGRPPHPPESPILTWTLISQIITVCAVMLAGALFLFLWHLRTGPADTLRIAEARTIAVNVLIVIQVLYLFQCRSMTRSIFQIGFLSNPSVLIGSALMMTAQLLWTYLPFMNRIFHSAPISWHAWFQIICVGIAGFLLIGMEKTIRLRIHHPWKRKEKVGS
jgi:Ca2+-transporting ATPase